MKRVGQRSKVRGQTVVVAIWIVAVAAVCGVYRLRHLHGELATLCGRDGNAVGRRVPSAPQSLHNEIALSGDCGGQETARPTGTAVGVLEETVVR